MKRKVSMLEILQCLLQVGLIYMQFLCDSKKNCSSEQKKSQAYLILFILLVTIVKTKIEGNRWMFIIWLPSFILSIFHKIFHTYTQVEVVYISALLSTLYILLMICFPIYEIPQVIDQTEQSEKYPKYNVSCASFPIDQQKSSMITAYYPTSPEKSNSESSEGDLCMLESDFWDYHYSSIFKQYKVPGFILDIALSGLKKYKVKVEANLPVIQKTNLKPIIFSHGFMGSRTMYSIIMKQLASLGYVVFCVEHYDVIKEKEVEKIKDKVLRKNLFKEVKEQELEARASKIKSMIDLIQDEKELNRLFKQNLSLDKNNITLMGHSYGGATVQCSAFKYTEHVKALVCLDPWLFPMKDSYLEQKLNIPVLYINSESFNKTMLWAEIDQRNQKIFQNCQQKEKSLICYVKDMDHIQQGDIGLAIPYEAKIVNLIRYPLRTLEFNLYNAKLIELFLNNIAFSNQKPEADHLANITKNIFNPLKRDSFQFFRQEFQQNFDSNRQMYTLEFKGKSIFQ
ncbi:platelet-activating factor acetylhydrolase (macronuclear) [Tetrahymena thermophila SB210]|uniref:1-alkyl-2-acetylglycerophosphocholine esterase n=1 Tax=Tetrahymena thermophila (strain SB210) TaxID=312017 RepID=Q22MT6_TETTS|nr:platelet-activating factor acetylhydrolase [Tetrahymena thermophila SB210]EAR86444.2 platelet-activating factor acetylhydrolase [Tetrahymena thermophila SB210]|eukprot:XP_976934.2 platelet-activating factor acetylhydrolase [Tetrahymena thermophila SB210]